MPELPEVETVKNILSPLIVSRTIKEIEIIYPRLIQSDINLFKSNIINRKIVSLSRKGKYLILDLDDDYELIVHFRMEGKFFNLPSLENNINKATSLYFKLDNDTYLLFNDTRKFGVMYLKKKDELYNTKPLTEVGPEPWEIDKSSYLLEKYKNINKPIKETLLDQKIMAGLGNIYADEVLFKSQISPFMKAKEINDKQAEAILANSIVVLRKAIDKGGSTIKSYHPSKGVSGNFQNELFAYGREGKQCLICNHKMEKRYVNGRGTTYCPSCQHVRPSIGLTGKIGSGKSMVLSYFNDCGAKVISCDEIVHDLYSSLVFLKECQHKFPYLFDEEGILSKELIQNKLLSDKAFRRKYQLYIWKKVKDIINDFLIENYNYITVVEVPLLFESHMDKIFTLLVGVETTSQERNLLIRGDKDIEKKISLNSSSSAYESNHNKLNYVIENEGSLEDLKQKVNEIFSKINLNK